MGEKATIPTPRRSTQVVSSSFFAALAESRELRNLLTLRLEFEIAVEDRLKRLDTLTEELLALLPVTD